MISYTAKRNCTCRISQAAYRCTRPFSTSRRRCGYEDTIQNLKIGKHTRVIFQGFTGRQATANAKESIEWGTNIVGGVKPGTTSEHLGLPVLPSVREAKEKLSADATGIYVAAHQATAAIEEAIEAEIPLIVAVAEHIPLHDVLRIHSMLSTQSKSRLVGANAPGIISAIGHCRIGFQPLPCFSPGHIGVVAKSGTLSYEAVAALTRAGLGQSICIGMGGDVVAGTSLVDGLKVFEHDDDTHGILIVGEVGGYAEEEAAEWIKDYRKRSKNPKPIAAVVGGKHAKAGSVMGHAGAWAGPGQHSAEEKFKILQDAGVEMVTHPSYFGNAMKKLLSGSGRDVDALQKSAAAASQKRGFHTMLQRPTTSSPRHTRSEAASKRSLHLNASQGAELLKEQGIEVSTAAQRPSDERLLILTIDRSARSPTLLVSPTTNPPHAYTRATNIPFDIRQGLSQTLVNHALERLQLDAAPPQAKAQAADLINKLWKLFIDREGVVLTVHISVDPSTSNLVVRDPNFTFDDAALKSGGRQKDLHARRDTSAYHPSELEAEKDGIVYVRLGDDPLNPAKENGNELKYCIGTVVNGAGLAMNTVDALALASPKYRAANFLDTGGKATSETVKQSFNLVLRDDRVKVVFVNIFGGLTLCDMIAKGIILAFKELSVGVPVVVRLRGTNEELGQKIIAESGLPLFAFDGFDEAAEKVMELAKEAEE